MVKVNSALKPRVLVADDSEDILALLEKLICDEERYRCELAVDGQDALNKYVKALRERDPFKLLILDAAMPYKSGFEVSKAVREEFGDKDTPVIIITAYVEPINEAHKDYVDADAILSKPFDHEELRCLLHVTLEPVSANARVATKVLMAAHGA